MDNEPLCGVQEHRSQRGCLFYQRRTTTKREENCCDNSRSTNSNREPEDRIKEASHHSSTVTVGPAYTKGHDTERGDEEKHRPPDGIEYELEGGCKSSNPSCTGMCSVTGPEAKNEQGQLEKIVDFSCHNGEPFVY